MKKFRSGSGIALPLGVLALSACRGFIEPSPELIEKLNRTQGAAPLYLREKVTAKIVSPWISGEFDGIILARTGQSPCVRLQLFPEVGGKVIDLLATPNRIAGYLPQTGQGADHPLPLRGRPDAIHVMGILLLEHYAGGLGERACGMRETDGGWEVLMRPAAEAFDVVVLVGRDGLVRRRRFEWSCCVGWEQVLEGDGRFKVVVGEMSLSVRTIESKPLRSVGENLFELILPPDLEPLDR